MHKICLLLLSCLITLSFAARAQEIKYTHCPGCWNADSLGNHRALLHFDGTGTVARAVIPWRRRDKDPASKRVIVQDAKTGQRILNARTGGLNRETAEALF